MKLRDRFAMAALIAQGPITAGLATAGLDTTANRFRHMEVAKTSYRVADAMLNARKIQ